MKYLTQYFEDETTNLYAKFGAFFAFGQDQFDKASKEGVTYVSMGSGLICPKDNAKDFSEGMDSAMINARRNDLNENGAVNIIKRNYFNYETHISGENDDLMDSLVGYKKLFPTEFTDEIISKNISVCWNKAVQEDLF